jgi:hypothetical protein
MWITNVLAPEVALARGPVRAPRPLAAAVWAVTWRCLAWGLGIGIAAGALAGTVLMPGAGTVVGAVVGCYVAVLPTALGWLGLLVLLGARHRGMPAPAMAARHVGAVLVTLLGILLAIALCYGGRELLGTRLTSTAVGFTLWLSADLFVTTWAVVLLLRRATDSILVGWARPWGWQVPRPAELRLDQAEASSVATRDGRR